MNSTWYFLIKQNFLSFPLSWPQRHNRLRSNECGKPLPEVKEACSPTSVLQKEGRIDYCVSFPQGKSKHDAKVTNIRESNSVGCDDSLRKIFIRTETSEYHRWCSISNKRKCQKVRKCFERKSFLNLDLLNQLCAQSCSNNFVRAYQVVLVHLG